MFEGLLGGAPKSPRSRRSDVLSGRELLEHAVGAGERVTLLLGEPNGAVRGQLRTLDDQRLVVMVPSLGTPIVEGHLILCQMLVLGRSVAAHVRVAGVTPSQGGALLRLDLDDHFLVMQARRAFRIPARGLDISFSIPDLDQKVLLHDISLQGAGVVVEGAPLTAGARVQVALGFGERNLLLHAEVVGHFGDVTGLLLRPDEGAENLLRQIVMQIERGWIARERRVR